MTVTERLDIPGTYTVQSGDQLYNCDLRNPFEISCDCPDFLYRERVCKHLSLCLNFAHGEPCEETL